MDQIPEFRWHYALFWYCPIDSAVRLDRYKKRRQQEAPTESLPQSDQQWKEALSQHYGQFAHGSWLEPPDGSDRVDFSAWVETEEQLRESLDAWFNLGAQPVQRPFPTPHDYAQALGEPQRS